VQRQQQPISKDEFKTVAPKGARRKEKMQQQHQQREQQPRDRY